jgi:hypothetical protein
MTELDQIENRVLKLSPADFEKFRKWFREHEWNEWIVRSSVIPTPENLRLLLKGC